MFGVDLEVGLIKKGDNKAAKITADELYEFINFNEFDDFDPIRETYNMFVDDNSKFNLTKYREMHEMLGLPPVSRQSTLREILELSEDDNFSFEKFRQIMLDKC